MGKGDYRKAVIGELFRWRMDSAHTRRAAVTEAFEGLPDLYPLLFGEAPVSAREYEAALASLPTDRATLGFREDRIVAGTVSV